MTKSKTLLSESEITDLGLAIADAEASNCGEIVPVVAASSGRYDRAEDIVGLCFGTILLAVGWWSLQHFNLASDAWTTNTNAQPGLLVILALFFVGFIAGTTLASYFPVLRSPFVSRKEMQDEVERRAMESFHQLGVGKTRGETGVLIYISLFERMVRIEGDIAINEKLRQQDWQEICDRVIEEIQRGRTIGGLKLGIDRVGKVLNQNFPNPSPTDTQKVDADQSSTTRNQLTNTVYMLEAL